MELGTGIVVGVVILCITLILVAVLNSAVKVRIQQLEQEAKAKLQAAEHQLAQWTSHFHAGIYQSGAIPGLGTRQPAGTGSGQTGNAPVPDPNPALAATDLAAKV